MTLEAPRTAATRARSGGSGPDTLRTRPARITRLADFTMPMAVVHHLVELGARQWLTAAGDLARQRATDRVLEFTEDPFLVSDAESLLGAVRRS